MRDVHQRRSHREVRGDRQREVLVELDRLRWRPGVVRRGVRTGVQDVAKVLLRGGRSAHSCRCRMRRR